MKPTNTALPFFTYGSFRPGDIPFLRINSFVVKVEKTTIRGTLMCRDGLILFADDDFDKVEGFLIYFKPSQSDEAYDQIAMMEPKKIYRWGEKENAQKERYNILIGKAPFKGSEGIREIDGWETLSTRNDSYFTTGIAMLGEFIAATDSDARHNGIMEPSFRLQMNYLFLWTIIERFIFFRYEFRNMARGRKQMASNKYFIEALKLRIKAERTLHSTEDQKKYTLNRKDSVKSINYYYQVRNNLTHRGKGINNDYMIVKDSLGELYEIFGFMLKHTINECEKQLRFYENTEQQP
jgi:hypothetical protein|tara:strand:- start:117 stop:998 length:882 start_codon:yes stop_codon:yes gene_type:complete